jgi:hypothetical protein
VAISPVTVPGDTKTPGTAGHTSDHNTIVDAITTIANAAAATAGDTFTGEVTFTAASDLKLGGRSAPSNTASFAKGYADNASGKSHVKYVSDDGVSYATGRVTARAAGQTVSSTSMVDLTGLSVSVGIGTYKFRLKIALTANASAGQWGIQLVAPTTSDVNYEFRWTSAAGVSALNVNRTTFSAQQSGPNPSVAGAYWAEVEGTFTTTAAGTFKAQGLTTIGADTWTMYTSATLEAWPLV